MGRKSRRNLCGVKGNQGALIAPNAFPSGEGAPVRTLGRMRVGEHYRAAKYVVTAPRPSSVCLHLRSGIHLPPGEGFGRGLRRGQNDQRNQRKGVPTGTPFLYLLAVRLHAVQLSDGWMQVSFLPGKNASIGKSIWLNTSQGFSSAAPETFGQLFVGMQ